MSERLARGRLPCCGVLGEGGSRESPAALMIERVGDERTVRVSACRRDKGREHAPRQEAI